MNTTSDLAAQNVNCILTGDFNYLDIDWVHNRGSTKVSTDFIEMCSTLGLSLLVFSGTRGDSTLDLVLTNKASLVKNIALSPLSVQVTIVW